MHHFEQNPGYGFSRHSEDVSPSEAIKQELERKKNEIVEYAQELLAHPHS